MTAEKLTIALIGCGNIARAHWRGIRYVAPRIEVTAVVDTVPERADALAERTGAQAFYSVEAALSDGNFDAVDIMLPHDLHEETALACFAADKHVCLEKPIADTLVAAERIVAAGKASTKVFMVAEQAQYWADVVKVRELIDANAIGSVITGKACFYDPLNVDLSQGIPWRFEIEKSGGGICIDGGAHWIRPMRMMLGEISEVFCATSRHVLEREGESHAHAIFRFESGVIGSFQALESVGPVGPVEDFRITGTDGELVIERGRKGRLMAYTREHPEGHAVMDAFQGKVDSYGLELKDFSEAVLDGKELAAEPEFALGELRTALAMYRSSQSGTWEKVWD